MTEENKPFDPDYSVRFQPPTDDFKDVAAVSDAMAQEDSVSPDAEAPVHVISGIPFSTPDEARGTEPIEMSIMFVQGEIKNQLNVDPGDYTAYVVWFAYILGGFKSLVSTSLPDGRYYEVTYNKDADEFYVDTYVKVRNAQYTQNKEEETNA